VSGLPDIYEFVILCFGVVDVEAVWAISFIEFEWYYAAWVPEVIAYLLMEVEVSGVDSAKFAVC